VEYRHIAGETMRGARCQYLLRRQGVPGQRENRMFGWLRRRRLSEGGQRRLLIALARAEENLLDTHVRNALGVFEAVGDELPVDRALAAYLEAADPGEQRSLLIARRVMARLEGRDTADSRGSGRRRRKTND
jgi:hypothetical protein